MTTTAPTLVEPTQRHRDAAGELWQDLQMGEVGESDGIASLILETMARAFAEQDAATRSAVVEECAAIAEEAIRSVAPLTTPIASMIEVGTILINLPTAIRKLKESDNAG